jgi:transcriptional regulator with XRE-family HTH domain
METETLNRLKVVLAEKQKSQKWLAEELGKSVITVSRWVNNKMQPSVDQLFEIAKVLDVDVRMLLNTNKETQIFEIATKIIPNNTKI